VASIGLQVGALSLDLFTAIVVMAVVTTMAMPPMLRWAFARLPMSGEEQARLEREEFEARAFVPQIERLLVAVDASPSGRLASRLAGLLAGVRGIATTVLHLHTDPADPSGKHGGAAEESTAVVKAAAAAGGRAAPAADDDVDVTGRTGVDDSNQGAIAAEAHKGYGLLLIGLEPAAFGSTFSPQLTRSTSDFGGPFAVAMARGTHRSEAGAGPLNILVTVSGTRGSRHGAEVAIALAHASRGSVTALHADSSDQGMPFWRQRFGSALAPRSSANAAIREIVELGEHYGIEVHGRIRKGGLRSVLLRELSAASYELLVMGVSVRPGEQLFLGDLAAQILERAKCSLLFVSDEAREDSQTPR
jgi:nucleotide-binding universal stress UspA family protein